MSEREGISESSFPVCGSETNADCSNFARSSLFVIIGTGILCTGIHIQVGSVSDRRSPHFKQKRDAPLREVLSKCI